jgi:hypothetical protein
MAVVAIVPAKDRADTVGATVGALGTIDEVDRVLVVDDGSGDDTAAEALAAGAEVLRLSTNRGKAAAVLAGVEACPEAEVYLLVDADVGATAAAADRLLAPVLAGQADLVVGVLPQPGPRQGGFGLVKRLAQAGIRRACGVPTAAPLSGQRAVRASYVRSLDPVERFGLEVGMTVDAVRAGARLREVEVPMDHLHTGGNLLGLVHRARQGLDVVGTLWSRLTSARARLVGLAVATVLVVGGLGWMGVRGTPGSTELETGGVERVVLVGVPHLGLADLDPAALPALGRVFREGASAGLNVRTLSTRPSTVEAYASIGAGARVGATAEDVAVALPADARYEGTTAAEVVARRTGTEPHGDIVLPAVATMISDAGAYLSSQPGALGEALAAGGLTTAVVNNADVVDRDGHGGRQRPAASAVVDPSGSVGTGTVVGDALLVDDASAPYGLRANIDRYLEATTTALDQAELVIVDLGDTDRAASYRGLSSKSASEQHRQRALRLVDRYVGRLLLELDHELESDTLLLVAGVTPPTGEWELTPVMAFGPGVRSGSLHSASTTRRGLVTITDLAPTMLDVLDAEIPSGMIGRPLRYRAEPVDVAALQRLNQLAATRERLYYPMALTFVAVQALAYGALVVVISHGLTPRLRSALRLMVLTFAAWPLATFVERGIPGIEQLGVARQGLVWVLAAAVALGASRARRHPLAPLSRIAAATVGLLVLDVAAGAELQMASILGYSPHTAARYVGFGNTAFAVLTASAVVLAATHVAYAGRHREALLAAGALLAVVTFADIWPSLGNDVGGVLTMVPVFGLLMVALAGSQVSWRKLALFGGVTLVVLATVAAVDLLRPTEAQGHLAGFVSSVGAADGSAFTTIQRKWATNMRVFGQTIWTWMVPIATGFMLYVLVIARGWRRLLPPGSALRAGAVATVGAGLVGWLVNDSGVVVSALVFVFVGPYLALLALHEERTELLPATDTG